MDRMEAEKWEVGAAFLPASLGYLVGTGVFGGLAGLSLPRWRTAQTGLKVIGVSLAMVSQDGVNRSQEEEKEEEEKEEPGGGARRRGPSLTPLGCDVVLRVTTSLSE